MIFARRAIQRRLNDLRGILGDAVVNPLVKRLNHPGKDRLAAMWEVAILHSLAPLGALTNEAALVSGKRPDIAFGTPTFSFIADITSVSDDGLNEQNPYREFSELIEKSKRRLGLKTGGMDIRVQGKREQGARGTRTYLRLPPRKRLAEFVRNEVEPRLREQIAQAREVLHVTFEDDRAAFQITIDPKKAPYNTGGFPSYNSPTVPDQNPLYNALRSKAGQLKGAGGVVGIIVGDGGTRTLADRSGHWSEVGARDIAEEFLRQNSSISFILLLSVREERTNWPALRDPCRKLHALLAVGKTQPCPPDLEMVLRALIENMPQPTAMPVNAALHAREARYGWGHHGGGELSGNRIKISAREIMEVLAGQRTISEMNRARGWFLAADETRSGGGQNPFERWLMQGRLPASMNVTKTGENDADDWIEIEVGDPDPAISRFR